MISKTVAAAAIAAMAVTACGGGSSPAKAASPPAECASAQSAVSPIAAVAGHYTNVSSMSELISADEAVASDPAATGTESSNLAKVTAAKAGAPSVLSVPLTQMAAEFQALTSDNSASPVDPSTVASDAQAVMTAVAQINSVCAG